MKFPRAFNRRTCKWSHRFNFLDVNNYLIKLFPIKKNGSTGDGLGYRNLHEPYPFGLEKKKGKPLVIISLSPWLQNVLEIYFFVKCCNKMYKLLNIWSHFSELQKCCPSQGFIIFSILVAYFKLKFRNLIKII